MLETLASFLDFSFNPLEFKNKSEQISYLRGYFDAEGGIPRDGRMRFYIQLVQRDRDKLIKIKKILTDLGIEAGKIHNPSKAVDHNYWRMYILRDSQSQFAKVIGSWHPRKIAILRKRMVI